MLSYVCIYICIGRAREAMQGKGSEDNITSYADRALVGPLQP